MEIINQTSSHTQVQQETSTPKVPDDLVGLSADITGNLADTGDINPVDDDMVPKVTVEQKHKDAFLKSIIENSRYVETVDLFNGSLKVTIRSRTAEETDAIMSYIRHVAITSGGLSDYEYSSRLRVMMLAAQIAQINDTVYPELRAPLFATEDKDGKKPPAWVEDLVIWSKKSDAIVSALSNAVSAFEARYWLMIRESSNINFWQPGTSTGQ